MLGIYFTNIGNIGSIKFDGESFSSITFNALGTFTALVYPNYSKDKAFYHIDNEWIVIDGSLYDKNKELTAEFLFYQIKSDRDIDFKSLNGEFFIGYFINGNLCFVNDRMGQRQHCIVEKGNVVSIAPTPGSALRQAKLPKIVNKDALYFFINSKKLRLDRSTIWNDCKVIDPATIFSFNDCKLDKTKYWQLSFSSENLNASVDELVSIYKNAVNTRVNNEYNKALTLTGGLDSRTMLCAVDDENLSNIKAVTSGMKGCTEVKYASEVARSVGVPHQAFDLEGKDIFSEEALAYFEDEDIDLLIQSQWFPFLNSIGSQDYLLHGLDLDVTIGGIYLTDALFELTTQQDLVEYINKESFINLNDTRKLFLKDKVDKYHHVVNDAVEKVLSECPQECIYEKYDYFILMHSMNRVILQRYRTIRNKLETVSPMYDIDLMDFYLKVPIDQRNNYKLFHPFMKKVCGKEASIKYQRTNLPADAPVSLWAESQLIEKQTEELYRTIARETNGECLVHYNGYYTNVDEWLRFDKYWIHALKELLLSNDSIIMKEWLDSNYVHKIIDEHLKHEKSHMSTLMRLMSAEVFLRVGDGWSVKK